MEWPLPRLQLMGWVCEIMTAVRSAEPAGGLPQQRQRLQLSWRHPRGLPGTQFRSASSPCRGADGHTRNSRPRGPSQIPPGPAVLMTLPHWVGHVGRAGLDAPRPRGAQPSISCHTQAASLWAAFFNLPNSHLGLGLFFEFHARWIHPVHFPGAASQGSAWGVWHEYPGRKGECGPFGGGRGWKEKDICGVGPPALKP